MHAWCIPYVIHEFLLTFSTFVWFVKDLFFYLTILLQVVHVVAELCKVSPNQRLNSKLEGFVIITFECVPTKEDCVDACSFNNDCHSINFFQRNKTCELNNANHISSPVSLIKVIGSDYINYDKRPPTKCGSKGNNKRLLSSLLHYEKLI